MPVELKGFKQRRLEAGGSSAGVRDGQRAPRRCAAMKAQSSPTRRPIADSDVFRTLRARVEQVRGADLGQGDLRILSFGCSIGFEMKTLRAYFPDASIFGCDTSIEALGAAQRNLREDPGIVFYSTPQAIDAFGPFDIILAMSVLCQFPANSQVDNLDFAVPVPLVRDAVHQPGPRNLRPGGLFCLVNANYLFSALEVAPGFRPSAPRSSTATASSTSSRPTEAGSPRSSGTSRCRRIARSAPA